MTVCHALLFVQDLKYYSHSFFTVQSVQLFWPGAITKNVHHSFGKRAQIVHGRLCGSVQVPRVHTDRGFLPALSGQDVVGSGRCQCPLQDQTQHVTGKAGLNFCVRHLCPKW